MARIFLAALKKDEPPEDGWYGRLRQSEQEKNLAKVVDTEMWQAYSIKARKFG